MNHFILEYNMKDKQFYVSGSFGIISINSLLFESNEFHWKEKKLVKDIFEWIENEHPELLI